jgi:hypothetical protein
MVHFVLVIVAYNRVILFLNIIPERTPSGYEYKQCGFLCGLFLRVSIPLILDMGVKLKEKKCDIFSIENIMDRKIHFEQIRPFI